MNSMNPVETFEDFKRTQLDPRTTLCDVALRGGALEGIADAELQQTLYQFAAEHTVGLRVSYANASHKWVAAPRIFLRAQPEPQAETVSELLYGEAINVYDSRQGYCRVAAKRDRYLGWLPITAISHQLPELTHRVIVPRTHLYARPQVDSERLLELSLGTQLHLQRAGDTWSEVTLKGTRGYIKSALMRPIAHSLAPKPGSVTTLAKAFLYAPYSWGGVTAWGLDCSGLVQTVFLAHGVSLPRDADQQAEIGHEVTFEQVQEADLLFFPGHVAISLGGTRTIHANAHHMRVSIDDLSKSGYGATLLKQLTGVRRVIE
jgi:cell wall-associated NlpC family hydrolase